jgi:hypothetical protein
VTRRRRAPRQQPDRTSLGRSGELIDHFGDLAPTHAVIVSNRCSSVKKPGRATATSTDRTLSEHCAERVVLDASHSPFLSMPDRVVDVLVGAWERARA